MFGWELLDALIGLALIYFILSILCSAMTEIISGILKLRAHDLEESLKQLILGKDAATGRIRRTWNALGLTRFLPGRRRKKEETAGPDLFDRFKNSPLVAPLGKLPSYLPAEVFSTVLLKREGNIAVVDPEMEDSNAGRAALKLIEQAQRDYEKSKLLIEKWFDSAMDRTTEWYKRMAFVITLLVATVVCFALNADTFAVVDALLNDPAARDATVAFAEGLSDETAEGGDPTTKSAIAELCPSTATPAAGATPTPGDSETASLEGVDLAKCLRKQFGSLALPIGGWDQYKPDSDSRVAAPAGDLHKTWPFLTAVDWKGWTEKSVGILVTAFALTLGAPFWFGLLTKLVNVRSAGKRLTTRSEDEKTEKNEAESV